MPAPKPRRSPTPGGGSPRPGASGSSGPTPSAPTRLFWVLLLVFMGVNLLMSWIGGSATSVPYSRFQEWLDDGRVADLRITSDTISGRLLQPGEGEPEQFRTVIVEPELADRLSERGVEYTGLVQDTFLTDLLGWLLPVVLIVVVWLWIFKRMAAGRGGGGLGGGMLSIGKSRAKVYVEEQVGVTFADVAGVDEAKEELAEIIAFLTEPERYGRLGGRLPKGILLVGPPGTGKTLLARAVAGEAGVPFFSISGSEFVELFVGVGAARVRDLFEQARGKAPCIVFIDELDALGRARGIGPMSGGRDEKEQTLNQLLVEMDGFDPSQGVVLLAATNRPEILDPALLRAGRFDRQVLVDRPDKRGREAILTVHAGKVDLDPDVSLTDVAALTPGFTGADLANLVNEATLLATRRDAEHVGMDDFTAAIERIIAGLEKKNRLLNEHERRVTAYHEMGHALVAGALPGTDPVHKVSIIPRGVGALGYTIQRPLEDRFLMSRGELLDKMTVLLGGRAAEVLVFDEISTGAQDDLMRCTEIARSMVTRYGMHAGLGPVSYEGERRSWISGDGLDASRPREFSEQTAREIDCAVRELVEASEKRAGALLLRHRSLLEQGAELLLERETLTADEIPVVPMEGALE